MKYAFFFLFFNYCVPKLLCSVFMYDHVEPYERTPVFPYHYCVGSKMADVSVFLSFFFRTQTIVLKGLKYFTRRRSCFIVQATLVVLTVSKLTFFFFVLVSATFSMEETAAAVAWQSVTLARGAWNLSSLDILCSALKTSFLHMLPLWSSAHYNLIHLGAEQPWSHDSLAFISISFCGRYAIFLVYTAYILNVQVAPLSRKE